MKPTIPEKGAENKLDKPQFSASKKALFGLIIILIPFLLIALLELTLRIANYGDDYKMFVEIESYGKKYKICNPEYGKKYFFNFTYTTPQNDRFLKEKTDSTFRIFVLGSSSVYGFPYNSAIMFTRILHERLQDAYPNKNIEVVNTAITAICSYTFIDKIDEILAEEPDAILIYAGHNEFYGALGMASKEGVGETRWLKLLHLNLLEFRTYQMIRNFIASLQRIGKPKQSEFQNETATLMQRIVSNKNIEYKSDKYVKAHEQYRKNMDAVLKKAKNKGVPVFISDLVGIVKDLEPFGSSKTEKYPAAIDVYKQALEYEKIGNFAKAKENYYWAKDLDCIRFRASEEINGIIKEIAQKEKAIFVPMKEKFQQNSPNGLIGHNLLTEHVHPNVDGYFLMADVFYHSILNSGLIGEVDQTKLKPSTWYRKNWGFTTLDSTLTDLRIKQLTGGWPFKSDTIINQFLNRYKPQNIIDSLAYQDLRYDDVNYVTTHKKLANYFIQRNEFGKAAQEIYALAKADPYDNQLLIEGGELFLKAIDQENALINQSNSIKTSPESANLKKSKPINFQIESYYLKALELFRKSVQLTPEALALFKLGMIHCRLHQYKEAIPLLEKAKENVPEIYKDELLGILTEAYSATGQNDKANAIRPLNQTKSTIENKNQLVVYASSKTKELVNEALALLKSKKTDEALKILYRAIKIEDSPIVNRLIGEVLLNKGDQESLNYLKKAYKGYNSDPVFLNTLCYACISFNDLNVAQKVLIELRQVSPNNANLKKFEAMIAEKRK